MRKRRVLLAGLVGLAMLGTTVMISSAAYSATTIYEAESTANTLSGGARVTTCTPCSSGKKVGYVGNNAGTLLFNGVTAANAGSFTLTIRYATGSARKASLSVNSGAAISISFGSTGGFTTVGTKTVTVTLRAGKNTLKFFNTSAWAPDFDRVSVVPVVVPSGPPTASELLAKVTSCSQVSTGKYPTDTGGSATVAVCNKTGAVFWQSDLDIDCNGRITPQCNDSTDPFFANDTSFHQSNGAPLDAAALPYVVVPDPSGIWDYRVSKVHGGSVVAVIYQGKVVYAVVGDTGSGDVIGQGSYALAAALGINPAPSGGGAPSGVTFIVFTGDTSVVSPIENHDNAVTLGQRLARAFINN
jgi:hypothetical protein